MRRRKSKQLRALGEGAAAGQAPRPGEQGRPQPQVTRAQQKRARRRRGPARQTRWMRVLGLIIAIGGGVAVGFGWAGAASKGCVDCQIPYLLSGGAAGLGLIVFGVGLLLLAQIRTESRRLGDRIEHALRVRDGEPRRPATSEAHPRPEASAGARPESVAESPNPLSAVPVDAPAAEGERTDSDAATVAATTVAGGVVETETDAEESTRPPALVETSEGPKPEAVQPAHEASVADGLDARARSESSRRRGIFRRKEAR